MTDFGTMYADGKIGRMIETAIKKIKTENIDQVKAYLKQRIHEIGYKHEEIYDEQVLMKIALELDDMYYERFRKLPEDRTWGLLELL